MHKHQQEWNARSSPTIFPHSRHLGYLSHSKPGRVKSKTHNQWPFRLNHVSFYEMREKNRIKKESYKKESRTASKISRPEAWIPAISPLLQQSTSVNRPLPILLNSPRGLKQNYSSPVPSLSRYRFISIFEITIRRRNSLRRISVIGVEIERMPLLSKSIFNRCVTVQEFLHPSKTNYFDSHSMVCNTT